MSLEHFVRKYGHITKEQGAIKAGTLAAQEIGLYALEPIAAKKSTAIWQEDWDVALILDATRFDLWNEVVKDYTGLPLNKNTGMRWSVGSASMHWINETFAPRWEHKYKHAGYVTANPFSGKESDTMPGLRDDVYPLQNRNIGYIDEVWRDSWPMNDNMATVDPSLLTERGLHAYKHADVDRLVLHYMQPHAPFRSRPEWTDGWGGAGTFGEPNPEEDSHGAWQRLRSGDLDKDELWDAYKDNLRWVLGEVKRWYEHTEAKILVTSDHGNAKGEFGQYSHPPNSANPYLRKVPWTYLHGVGEKSIGPKDTRKPPIHLEDADVNKQLKHLGYKV